MMKAALNYESSSEAAATPLIYNKPNAKVA